MKNFLAIKTVQSLLWTQMIKILQIKFSGILGQINGIYILKKSDHIIRHLFKQNFTSNFTISPDFIVLFFVTGISNCAFVISFFSLSLMFFFSWTSWKYNCKNNDKIKLNKITKQQKLLTKWPVPVHNV